MSRYQVYRLLCRLLLAAVAGAGVIHAVLVGLGVASIDGTNGVAGQVFVSVLYAASAGAVFLRAVRAIRGGKWRRSTERDLRWRPPRNGQEWRVLSVLVVVVLIGAGVAVVGFLGGLRFKDLSGTTFDVAPAAFWVAGGVLMLGGVVALLADMWRDEVDHMTRDTQRPLQQDVISRDFFAD